MSSNWDYNPADSDFVRDLREAIRELLDANPDMSVDDLAEKIGRAVIDLIVEYYGLEEFLGIEDEEDIWIDEEEWYEDEEWIDEEEEWIEDKGDYKSPLNS